MKTEQLQIQTEDISAIEKITIDPNLIFVFGGSKIIASHPALEALKKKFPEAKLTGCSTSGEILDTAVSDETIAITAVEFSKTKVKLVEENVDDYKDSDELGKALINQLPHEDLAHIMVFSDGLNINGSQLVQGMRSQLPAGITVTGGLAGDGSDFTKTYVIDANAEANDKIVVGIGFYNPELKVGYGSLGGWDTFGMERLVTKSKDNVLFEIDGMPALELYKSFLGAEAQNLPASGLLFPLSMRLNDSDSPVVRTILAVNDEENSLTFAGDIPEGAYVKLMKANIDRLITGAEGAAKVSHKDGESAELAILISCVGRKLVLKQLVEEEVEAVQNEIGENAAITGFYSYGEIAPFLQDTTCELHNQTMTITTFSE